MGGYPTCYGHRSDLADERRRNASKGGKAGGRGRPASELAGVKAQLQEMADKVLSGALDRGDAAVAGQLLNIKLRALETERKWKETSELEGRIAALEEPEGEKMGSMKRRLGKLEDERRREKGDPDEETMPDYGEFWEMHIEWTALHLVRGFEPDFTLDGSGAFVTPDGRFAVSRERMDLRGLSGPRTEAMQDAIANTPERWRRFLEAAEEAAELLERILELGEATAVPEDYETPLIGEWTQEEVDSFKGTMKPTAIFMDAEERARVRALTWTLVNNPDARAMLSELTCRRDAFVAEEGLMPEDLPLY
jgi:hypothetical protein